MKVRLPQLLAAWLLCSAAAAQTPVVSISSPDANAAETLTGAVPDTGLIRISRTGSTAAALGVSVRVRGLAVQGTDYRFGSLTIGSLVTIPAGRSSVDIPVVALDDALTEGVEDVRLELRDSSSGAYLPGTADRADIDIADNEDPTLPPRAVVSVTALDNAAAESAGDAAVFRVTREGNAAVALNVRYTIEGTATSGSDYTPPPGSVLLPAGTTFVDVAVNVRDDSDIEPLETMIFRLLPTDIVAQPSPAEAYVLGSVVTAGATITNDDFPPPPVAVITSPGTNAAAQDGQTMTVTFDAHDPDGHIVSWSVLGGTVTVSGTTDYASPPAAGTVYQGTATVTLTGRYTYRNLNVRVVDNTGTVATSAVHRVYMIPPQPPHPPPPPPLPVINIHALDGEATESYAGGDTARFRVTHDFDTTNPVWFMAVLGGTAKPGDYSAFPAAASSFLGPWYQIPAGQSEMIIEITPVDDGFVEGAENVTLSLYTPPFIGFTEGGSNGFAPGEFGFYYGTNASASVVIQDNDTQPPDYNIVTITATDPVAVEAQGHPDPAVFTLTRTGLLDAPLSVRYQFTAPSRPIPLVFPLTVMAQNGADFAPLSGVAQFAPGSATAQIVIEPVFDFLVEPQELVQITLQPSLIPHTQPGGYAIDANVTAQATLFSYTGSAATPSVSITVSTRLTARRRFVRDSNGVTLVQPKLGMFNVSRSSPDLSQPLTVHYQIAGSAANGVDYETIGTSVTIPAGARSAGIVIRPWIDEASNGWESVVISLAPPPGGDPSYLITPKNRAAVAINPYFRSPAPTVEADPAPVTVAAPAVALLPEPSLQLLYCGCAVVTQESPNAAKLFAVECSTDMIHWQELDIIETEEGVAEYVDPDAGALKRCYYRLREVQ